MRNDIYLFLCLGMTYLSKVYASADPMWKVDDVRNKPISTLVSELTQKATGEFDKLYHQLEGVVGKLTDGWGAQEAEAQLDPQILSECSCYCRCPHKTDSSVVAQVKDSVLELKEKVESVGKSLKDKIHEITSR